MLNEIIPTTSGIILDLSTQVEASIFMTIQVILIPNLKIEMSSDLLTRLLILAKQQTGCF